ncbi:MAG: Rrf2 family transcriptional regulator, partial [Desulfobacterales bacterium]|nr:Rrf2 family transcriptional regulator [Desulfobacterales bacterium]
LQRAVHRRAAGSRNPQRAAQRMLITQKHKYALRAVFELAKRQAQGPIKLADIAQAQAIPLRFLEVIMSQLKGSGLVAAKRGYHGGYSLLKPPEQVTVGAIFRFIDDRIYREHCDACIAREGCPLYENCAFKPMWDRVCGAIYEVYDRTTIQDLLNNEKMALA